MASRTVDLIGGIRKRYVSSMVGLLKAYHGSNWCIKRGGINFQPQPTLEKCQGA